MRVRQSEREFSYFTTKSASQCAGRGICNYLSVRFVRVNVQYAPFISVSLLCLALGSWRSELSGPAAGRQAAVDCRLQVATATQRLSTVPYRLHKRSLGLLFYAPGLTRP